MFVEQDKMNKIYLSALFLLFHLATSCTTNTSKSAGNDTIVFQVHDDDNIDWMLFDYVKNKPYSKVYMFQEQETDEYGNKKWVNWWIIDDFTEQEYEEMKKYADYTWYLEKVLQGNSKDNKKYTWKNIRKK